MRRLTQSLLSAAALALALPSCDNPACVFGGDCSSQGEGGALGGAPASVPSDGEIVLAEGDPGVREDEERLIDAFREQLEKAGLVLSGTSPDGRLVEVVELADHPYFLGCQFHPEFKSRPHAAHPL